MSYNSHGIFLQVGEVYYDVVNKEVVEFRYIGGTGLAIVREPGDSGGGMQSCWGIDKDDLVDQQVDHDIDNFSPAPPFSNMSYLGGEYVSGGSLVIIKPDGVDRNLVGKIISRFEDAGLNLRAMKMTIPKREIVDKHYDASVISSSISEEQRQKIVEYMCSGAVVVFIVSGYNAITDARDLIGATDPVNARVGTIRGDWGEDSLEISIGEGRAVKNVIHASSSLEDYERECRLWFDCDTEGVTL